MTNKIEVHQKEWKQRSARISKNGALDKMKNSELYDLTWKTTTEFIVRKLALKENQHVFNAGFGWGRIIHGIKHYLPAIKIEGVELANELYEETLLLIKEQKISGVKLYCGDILDLKEFASSSFDAVYSTRVLHYMVDKKKALSNLYRILKPSGKIIIIIPNKFCPYRWFTYQHPLYSIIKLRKIMYNIGFQELKWGSIGFIPTFFGRIQYKSKLYSIEKIFQNIIGVDKLGGLAYVTGKKSK